LAHPVPSPYTTFHHRSRCSNLKFVTLTIWIAYHLARRSCDIHASNHPKPSQSVFMRVHPSSGLEWEPLEQRVVLSRSMYSITRIPKNYPGLATSFPMASLQSLNPTASPPPPPPPSTHMASATGTARVADL
jgi:hypothetical protein